MNGMLKRMVWVYFFMCMGFVLLIFRLGTVMNDPRLAEAASRQSSYTLEIAETRGYIYDRGGVPLVNCTSKLVAAAAPTESAMSALGGALNGGEYARVMEQLASGLPVAVQVQSRIDDVGGIITFAVPNRYSFDQPAAHIIGYTDYSGAGVSGVEMWMNKYLSDNSGTASVTYTANARGEVTGGIEPSISGEGFASRAGVVLTLDSDIQKITDRVMKQSGRVGAAVVLSAESGDILASSSAPAFSPLAVEDSLDSDSSPLINRVFTPYNVGSVFKLCVAAAALECGITTDFSFECTGSIDVEGHSFSCADGVAHGRVDMQDAMKVSCNVYFIALAEKVGAENILRQAKRLGLGAPCRLADGVYLSGGSLPKLSKLQNDRAALASFAFGQSDLLASPLQIAYMIEAIVNDGVYLQPRLIDSTVDNAGRVTEQYAPAAPRSAMSKNTAEILLGLMVNDTKYGSTAIGVPEEGGAGAKTGTAETGLFNSDGSGVLQTWYAGFFPADAPEYVLVVMIENGDTGARTAGPIFKKIADEINELG